MKAYKIIAESKFSAIFIHEFIQLKRGKSILVGDAILTDFEFNAIDADHVQGRIAVTQDFSDWDKAEWDFTFNGVEK